MGGLNPIVHGRIRAVPVCGNGSAGAGIKASFRQIIWEQAPFPGLRLIQPAHTRSAMPAMREQLSRSAGAVFFIRRLKTDAEQHPQYVRGARPLSAVRPLPFT
ncbi:MAG TPA: hypothetical protein DCM58_01565 [Desulfovibrio sp.]|nr:hypothetical protein [Desulfovibrio sp.]